MKQSEKDLEENKNLNKLIWEDKLAEEMCIIYEQLEGNSFKRTRL